MSLAVFLEAMKRAPDSIVRLGKRIKRVRFPQCLQCDNILHPSVINVLFLMMEHEEQCTGAGVDNGERCCQHVADLRNLVGSRLNRWIGRFRDYTEHCKGTWWTLNHLLRQEPFSVTVGKSGIKKLQSMYPVEVAGAVPEIFNARHLCISFMNAFLLARPAIAGKAFEEGRGGYASLFRGAGTLGQDCADAPVELKTQYWVRFQLRDDFKPEGSLDCGALHDDQRWRVERCFHGTAFECLANQLVHGLQPATKASGGRTQDEECVYFTKAEHVSNMKHYSDVVFDEYTGKFWSVAWEVDAVAQNNHRTEREKQCIFPRYGFIERYLWLRVLPANEDIELCCRADLPLAVGRVAGV